MTPPNAPPAELPLVYGALSDGTAVRRITSALRAVAEVSWFDGHSDLHAALARSARRVVAVILALQDPNDAAIREFAGVIRDEFPGVGIIVYGGLASSTLLDLADLGAAGVHDVLQPGVTDAGFTARTIILGAARRGAADLVMGELQRILPMRLLPFAEAVVRNPSKASIAKVTDHLGIHRQTPSLWCRKEQYLRPEELLVWCRVFLVGALLQMTDRTVESIALELEYPSATSLRNQLKNYTGMTATQIREVGVHPIVELFVGRVEQVQRGFAGVSPVAGADGTDSEPASRALRGQTRS